MKRPTVRRRGSTLLLLLAIVCSRFLHGQMAATSPQLPTAPQVSLAALLQQSTTPMPQGMSAASAKPSATSENLGMTQAEAEQMAVKNNPRVSVPIYLRWRSIRLSGKQGPLSCLRHW